MAGTIWAERCFTIWIQAKNCSSFLELKTNLSAISILDAGSRSAESGKMELANDAVWTVGTDPFL